ncbi:hypothetical protein [Apilactobacillus timberlakei]|uniref:Phage protein n=1 Tax=Apilactobacillus timberlakei TaxID=2008380 RepID=A0ABY2YVP0_9LACO|nr:hypothetical protein [Apilactobacillus timberlakei]TPR12788.1 hypothetical protein DY048_07195 [Apilactobacillus timberlakei]TPR13671.1 hypothetical protein DY052_08065 [Apilactobacillus timberlakei]
MPLPESRKRANKKWDDENKERKRYIVKRSTAKSFIKNYANQEDLDNLKQLIAYREDQLTK